MRPSTWATSPTLSWRVFFLYWPFGPDLKPLDRLQHLLGHHLSLIHPKPLHRQSRLAAPRHAQDHSLNHDQNRVHPMCPRTAFSVAFPSFIDRMSRSRMCHICHNPAAIPIYDAEFWSVNGRFLYAMILAWANNMYQQSWCNLFKVP